MGPIAHSEPDHGEGTPPVNASRVTQLTLKTFSAVQISAKISRRYFFCDKRRKEFVETPLVTNKNNNQCDVVAMVLVVTLLVCDVFSGNSYVEAIVEIQLCFV